MEKENKKSCCSGCLVKMLAVVGAIVLLCLIGFNLLQDKNGVNNSNPNLFERKATVQDITLQESYSFPVSVKYTITPKADIEDLEIKIDFLTSSGELLGTQYLEIGDVSSGRHYTKTMSITQLSASEALLAKKCRWSVSRGTISLLG